MIAPRVVTLMPTFGVAFWHNVVICNVQGHVDAQGVRGITDAFHKLYEAHPDGVVGITVLRASLKVGSTETNAEAKLAMAELRSKILHVAIVIENQGLLAPLLRAIIRTLNSVARSSRLSIATDLDAAARTIATHVAIADSRSSSQLHKELLEAVETVRRALPAADSL